MKSGFTYGIYKTRGFTLIEILIVLMIIALMARFALPRITYRGSARVDEYVNQVSRLTRIAYVYALITGKLHRVWFRITEPAEIRVEQATGRDSTGAPTFTLLHGSIIAPSVTVDSHIALRNFFVKGIDEAARGTLKEVWFYIFPLGITQDVIINIRDTDSGEERGLVLHPFSVKFTAYDTIQKP